MSRRRSLTYAHASSGSRVFVSDAQGGVSHSDDGGESWERVTVASAPTSLFGLARNANTGTICAVGNYVSFTGEVMRSTDNGASFSLVDIAGLVASGLRGLFVDAANKWFTFGEGYDDVHGSTDDGASFAKILDLGTGGAENKWAGAYANGLWIIAEAGDNYWTSTNGTSFTRRTNMGHTGYIRSIKYLNGKWFAVGQNGRVTVSETGVGDWTYVATSPAAVHWDISWNGSVYVLVGVYSTYATVFTSPNGTGWTDVTAMHLTGFTGVGITALPSGRLVAAFYQGATPTNGRIYTSDDNGVSWQLRVNSASYGYLRVTQ